MREGLRSQKRLERPETGKVCGSGVQKKGDGIKQDVFDLTGEGSVPEREALKLTIEKKDGVEQVVKEECELDCGVSTRGNVDLAQNGNNRSRFSCGDNIKDADDSRKSKKENSYNKVLISGRVLRSMSKRVDDTKSYNGENHGVFSLKNKELGGFEKINVKVEYEEADEFVSNGYEKESFRLRKGGTVRSLKRKRGRPPKLELKEQDQSVVQLKRNRGRPPMAGRKSHLPTVAHNKKGKMGIRTGKHGLTRRDDASMNVIDDMCSRSPRKELEKNGFSPVKKSKFGKVLPLRSKTVNMHVAEKRKKSNEKQLVRDQIMERLSAAGWTVDYRPRNGKEYNDAVYVSPDGKTHWSITLAYNRLKNHYEAGDGEGKVYRPGFIFTPIPEEDFNMLTKVINKKRESKKKWTQKGGKRGTTVGVNRKMKMGKLGSGAGPCKSMKGKMKRKWSHLEEDCQIVTSPNRMPVHVRGHKRQKTQNKKRCALLVRKAEEEMDSEIDGYLPYNGKRTVLAWMIDLGTILQNGKVHYMNRRRKVLDGTITGDGIHCSCCNKIVTISDFEVHAGSKLFDPLKNLHTEEGTSLLHCLLDSWNKQDESERKGFHSVDVAGEDPNDDTCGVCGDGGDLICCDGCPSTFHQSCLDIEKFPSGDWHCIYCCCKFCGLVGGNTNQRDGCDDFTMPTLLTCHLCEEKYHQSCIQANGAKIDDSRDSFFCGDRCQELSERLEMLLGVKHEIEDGFSWTFIRRSDVGSDASQIKPQMVECNSKLAVALSIMDECFMPYIDHRSGINLIHSILYNCGSNFNRLNYSGFVTAILERGDEIICAASIRIHGNKLAEMPFIGTRYMYRRQGMCRRLLNAIEWALSSLNVELLVIPAISELTKTWTSVFGFEPLELTSKQIIKNMNLLVFPHVDMLQKKISKQKFADENLLPTEVSNLLKNQTVHMEADDCDAAGSSGSDLIISAGIPPSNACQINEVMSIKSGSQLPDDSLNNIPDITSQTRDHSKCPKDMTCQVVCQAVHDNLIVEDISIANAHDYVSDTCYHAEKPIDLDSQLNSCCVTYEERHISIEPTEEGGRSVGTSLEVTENFPNENKVACEIVTNNNSAENSAHCRAECIPLDPQIVLCSGESKDSADSNHHNSKEVHAESVNGCGSYSKTNGDCASGEAVPSHNWIHLRPQNNTEDLPVNCEKNSGEEAEVCLAQLLNLQANKNSGDYESIPVSSDFCEKIADGVNEKSKAYRVAEADSLPADTGLVPIHKPWMKGPSELAEPDLQLDQTARSKSPPSCSPNTASGVALHWASTGSASCGSTEVIVLSNQAS